MQNTDTKTRTAGRPAWLLILCLATHSMLAAQAEERPRARDIGLVTGIFATGTHNAITDVAGVRVGHRTIIRGDDIRTGITAIIPASGNLYTHPIPAWIHVGNGYGKLIGETQVREFGEIEMPIILTCTLCVWRAAEGAKTWAYQQPGMGEHTVNPIVGETNDSTVNNMWTETVQIEDVVAALDSATSGPVEEGSVGAGTGTQAFGWKGGIGTSSRVLPESLGGYTVGILVQTNFWGELKMNGAPVGRELGKYEFQEHLAATSTATRDLPATDPDARDGSIMIVLATDAPLHPRALDRLAMRAIMGLARTGSSASNGSGDYVIAFSTNPSVRTARLSEVPMTTTRISNEAMSPLFTATTEATEEAIYNAILKASTVASSRGRLEAIPLARLLEVLEKHQVLHWDKTLNPAQGAD